MSDIKLNTEAELMEFLKIVAQESLSKVMSEVSDDPAVEQFKSMKKSDTKTFGTIKAEVDKEKVKVVDADASQTTNDASNEQQKGDDFAGSFQDLLGAINDLRSGRSVKDDDIKSALSEYYERLEKAEQTVLYTFLLELSKILTGAVSGDDAQDPSEPPLNYTISKKDNVGSTDSVKISKNKSSSGEDSSPPEEKLPISEGHDIDLLRKKVRQLMSK